jgi:hypothetical protein
MNNSNDSMILLIPVEKFILICRFRIVITDCQFESHAQQVLNYLYMNYLENILLTEHPQLIKDF